MGTSIVLGVDWPLQVNPSVDYQEKTIFWDDKGILIMVQAANKQKSKPPIEVMNTDTAKDLVNSG